MNKRNTKKSNSGKTPMDAALSYLSYRPRTIREMEKYLDGCNYGEYEIQQVIERLMELNYLNDQDYAKEFIRSRLATKPISKRALREQLLRHELSSDIVEEALAVLDDEAELEHAFLVGKKFFLQFEQLPYETRVQRTMKRLLTRGYSYSCIRTVMEMLEEELECNQE